MPKVSDNMLERSNASLATDLTASGPEHHPDSKALIDPARERRVKALMCTEPLHALQSGRGRREWERFDFYDLGLAAIDHVVDRMGFDSGISRQELENLLLFETRRFSSDASDEQLTGVTTELIETLIRPSIGEYTSPLDEVRRRFDFALLTEHENAEGGIYLRATNEAINVLVGGLNTDIESAQVAAEATLEHLIRRHRLDDAARPARDAKIRSIQYASFVRQVIEETRRDIRRAGWRENVPQRLDEIREHLNDRMRTEQHLLDAMQDARDNAVREDLRVQAAGLVQTVDDCFARHRELHAITLAAIRVYMEERDRQVFGRAAAVGAIDLTEEALLPILGATIGSLTEILPSFAERLLGFAPGPKSPAIVPRQMNFGDFVLALLKPPQLRDATGTEWVEPEWEEPTVDSYAFAQDAWAQADQVMASLDTPARLSTLLPETESAHGLVVADLLRLRALVATAPDLEAVRPGASPVSASAKDERVFRTGSFVGSDLLVGLLEADAVGYSEEIQDEWHRGNAEPQQIALLPSEMTRKEGT